MIASILGGCVVVICFVALVEKTGLIRRSNKVLERAKLAALDISNSELDDDAKEVAMQSHAKSLFSLFFQITLAALICLFLPLALIWGLERLNLLSLNAVLEMTVSWKFLLASSAMVYLFFKFGKVGSSASEKHRTT